VKFIVKYAKRLNFLQDECTRRSDASTSNSDGLTFQEVSERFNKALKDLEAQTILLLFILYSFAKIEEDKV
jgi:hypothetical protein